jgi:hypothetical protein
MMRQTRMVVVHVEPDVDNPGMWVARDTNDRVIVKGTDPDDVWGRALRAIGDGVIAARRELAEKLTRDTTAGMDA